MAKNIRKRPHKIMRLNYWKADPDFAAQISIMGDPAEVRIAGGKKSFMSVGDRAGISLSPGTGKHINHQCMSGNMRYGGLLRDLPFPFSILPNTPFTSFPAQQLAPPFLNQIKSIAQLAKLAASII